VLKTRVEPKLPHRRCRVVREEGVSRSPLLPFPPPRPSNRRTTTPPPPPLPFYHTTSHRHPSLPPFLPSSLPLLLVFNNRHKSLSLPFFPPCTAHTQNATRENPGHYTIRQVVVQTQRYNQILTRFLYLGRRRGEIVLPSLPPCLVLKLKVGGCSFCCCG